jgi:hypothetical protein
MCGGSAACGVAESFENSRVVFERPNGRRLLLALVRVVVPGEIEAEISRWRGRVTAVRVRADEIRELPGWDVREFLSRIEEDLNDGECGFRGYSKDGGFVVVEGGDYGVKLLLAPSSDPDYDYDLRGVRLASLVDFVESVERGAKMTGMWRLIRASEKPPPDCMTVIDRAKYDLLRDHEKVALNAAWHKLQDGRRLKSIRLDGEVYTLFEVVPGAKPVSGKREVDEMNAVLAAMEVGRATSSRSETRKLRGILKT